MIFFGEETSILPATTDVLARGKVMRQSLQTLKLDEIITVLDAFGKEWKVGGQLFNQALEGLKSDLPFSEDMVKLTLGVIPELLSKESLEKRVKGEFQDIQILDKFIRAKNGLGFVRAIPVGEMLHVTAGNVFISCIDSLVMGFLTKNISYLKLSSRNNFFPFFFAKSLIDFDKEKILADKFSMLIWKGGDEKIESVFKSQVPIIIAWGGEEMLESYRKGLGLGTKLLDYGPKISFQILTQQGIDKIGLTETGKRIANDLIMWDQQACSSPQNLFFENGINVTLLMKSIGDALDRETLERGQLSSDERVEILKERERARVSRILENGHSLEGSSWLLHHETRSYLRTSPLNRTLILKSYSSTENLIEQIAPFRFYLQSCGYLTGVMEKAALLESVAQVGVKRLVPIGQMSHSFSGLPHDGRYGLTELVNFVTDEVESDEDGLVARLRNSIPFYKDSNFERLVDIPLTDGGLFAKHDPAVDQTLVGKDLVGGRYFASGGTTGKPKHVFYSNQDFDRLCEDLAENFLRSGIKPGTKVANLFAAGALYSSFLAVDKYCEKIGLKQLPIGGLLDAPSIVQLLDHHKPEAIFGLPSLIIQYAQAAETQGIELSIPMVFYAGENLSESAREYLRKTWGTHTFWSAGYATVDAGVIGYQCAHTPYGVHHVMSPHVHLEIIDGEAVVTSFIREGMPVVRYRTGDHVEWVKGECECGESSKRFKLLGRMDSQINIWACRLPLSDIEAALIEVCGTLPEYQVTIETAGLDEKLTLLTHQELLGFPEALFEVCGDIRKTITIEQIKKWLVTKVENHFYQNPRTGKIPKLIDRR